MSRRPFLIVQLSDPHIDAADVEPYSSLRAAVAAIRGLPDRPDAVVVTGDLVESGGRSQYRKLQEALAEIGAPVLAVAGNSGAAEPLCECFALPSPAGRVRYGAGLGPLRFVVLDSTVPASSAANSPPKTCRGSSQSFVDRPRQTSVAGRAARLANASGRYHVTQSLAGREILLLDDVYTSGATMHDAARAAAEAQARSVRGIVYCRKVFADADVDWEPPDD